MTIQIGQLEPVPLRELWVHEERGFSAWLENNLDVLSEHIGLPLSLIERERSIGSFRVDMVAEDIHSNLVIIENQLESSDHDHLGKLITYMTNLDAKTAIWITSEPRPEHTRAIIWLNETTPSDTSFYLVKLSAYRIAESCPAPLFSVVAAPSEDSKAIGRNLKDLAERQALRLKFWEELLLRAKSKGVDTHANISPSIDNWVSASAGRNGLSYVYTVWLQRKTAVDLAIDTGDYDRNKQIYDYFYANKEQIEMDFGKQLLWERRNEIRLSRIRFEINQGGIEELHDWTALQESMIAGMDKLSKAMMPHIANLS